MNSYQVVACLDRLLEEREFIKLSDIQKVVIQATWEDKTYDDATRISEYGSSSLRIAGSALWVQLSEFFNCEITKRTFRSVMLEHKFCEQRGSEAKPDRPTVSKVEFLGVSIPTSFAFYGRSTEMYELSRLIENNRCIAVTGISGIGKRMLIWNTIQQMALPYSKVLWQPISVGCSANSLARDLLAYLEPNTVYELEDCVYQLLQKLRAEKHLIILENLDLLLRDIGRISLMDTPMLSFLTRLIEETETGLLSISQFVIRELEALDLRGFPTRIYTVEGLSAEDCQKILQEYGLKDKHLWEDLILSTGRHPLLLRQLARWSQRQMDSSLGVFERLTQQLNALSPLYDSLFASSYLSTTDRSILKVIASTLAVWAERDTVLSLTGASWMQLDRLVQAALVEVRTTPNHQVLVSMAPLLRKYVLSDPCDLVASPSLR